MLASRGHAGAGASPRMGDAGWLAPNSGRPRAPPGQPLRAAGGRCRGHTSAAGHLRRQGRHIVSPGLRHETAHACGRRRETVSQQLTAQCRPDATCLQACYQAHRTAGKPCHQFRHMYGTQLMPVKTEASAASAKLRTPASKVQHGPQVMLCGLAMLTLVLESCWRPVCIRPVGPGAPGGPPLLQACVWRHVAILRRVPVGLPAPCRHRGTW